MNKKNKIGIIGVIITIIILISLIIFSNVKDEKFYTPSDNGYEKLLIRAKDIKKNKG